jgi:hypothetical protein
MADRYKRISSSQTQETHGLSMTTAERLLTNSIEVNEVQNPAFAPISPSDLGASGTRFIAG